MIILRLDTVPLVALAVAGCCLLLLWVILRYSYDGGDDHFYVGLSEKQKSGAYGCSKKELLSTEPKQKDTIFGPSGIQQ